MKTLLLTILLTTYVLTHLTRDESRKVSLRGKQQEIDSLKRIIWSYQQDSVLQKMQSDMGYRIKILTLARTLTTNQICKRINKWKKQ